MSRGLNEIQRKVLGVLEEEVTKKMEAVLDDCGVKEEVFSKWLESRVFRRGLRKMKGKLRLRREVELARGAAGASRILGEAAAAAQVKVLKEGQRKACESVVRLARAGGLGRRMKKHFMAGVRDELAHPSLGPYGNKVLLELEQMRKEGKKIT